MEPCTGAFTKDIDSTEDILVPRGRPLGRHRAHGVHGARQAGVMRSEGKDYVVQDGDLLLFRFNV